MAKTLLTWNELTEDEQCEILGEMTKIHPDALFVRWVDEDSGKVMVAPLYHALGADEYRWLLTNIPRFDFDFRRR